MGQELTIGRAYSNLLRLEGEEISRVHCIIYRRGEDYVLRDLDSKNGVLLNGQKVGNIVINPGDIVQVGKYTVLFDPPNDFDLTGFLKRHNATLPRNEGATTPQAPTHELESTSEVDVTLHTFRADIVGGGNPIAFALTDIEEMSDTQYSQHNPQFLTELLRFHRQLAVTPAADETDDEEVFYQHVLQATAAAVGADRGVIVLRDETGDILRLGAILPRDRDVSVNRVVLRYGLREQKAVLCNDAQNEPRFAKTDTVRREKIGSLAAYPIVRGDATIGLIYVDVLQETNAFRREHLLLLYFVARMLLLYRGRKAPVKN